MGEKQITILVVKSPQRRVGLLEDNFIHRGQDTQDVGDGDVSIGVGGEDSGIVGQRVVDLNQKRYFFFGLSTKGKAHAFNAAKYFQSVAWGEERSGVGHRSTG